MQYFTASNVMDRYASTTSWTAIEYPHVMGFTALIAWRRTRALKMPQRRGAAGVRDTKLAEGDAAHARESWTHSTGSVGCAGNASVKTALETAPQASTDG